jgi:hypothetical protein
MKKLLLALAVMMPLCAQAEYAVYAGGWSKHIGRDDLNGVHDAKLVEYDGFVSGEFTNSFNKLSYMAGYSFELYSKWDLTAGVKAGFVRGYTEENLGELDFLYIGNDWSAMAAPYIRYDAYDLQPEVLVLGSAIALMFRYTF